MEVSRRLAVRLVAVEQIEDYWVSRLPRAVEVPRTHWVARVNQQLDRTPPRVRPCLRGVLQARFEING
jgi:hypothetical protein